MNEHRGSNNRAPVDGRLEDDLARLGDVERVHQTYRRGLERARSSSRTHRDIMWSIHSANLYGVQGRLDDAERDAVRALRLAREVDDGHAERILLGLLGRVALNRKQLDIARNFFQTALQMTPPDATCGHAAMWWTGLSSVACDERRFDDARGMLQRALDIGRRLPDRYSEGRVRTALGALALAQRQPYSAQQHLAAAEAALCARRAPLAMACLTARRGQLAHAMGDDDVARTWLTLAQQAVVDLDMTPEAVLAKQVAQLRYVLTTPR